MSDLGRIRHVGMGGFLDPPTHPHHTHSVQSRTGDTFSMSLKCAAYDSPWLDESTRLRAKEILESWHPLPIDSIDVQDWIRQVLGYFRGCYRGDGPEPECWHVAKLHIVKDNEARPNEQHAGVHLIREYYPQFEPTALQFQEASWGTVQS